MRSDVLRGGRRDAGVRPDTATARAGFVDDREDDSPLTELRRGGIPFVMLYLAQLWVIAPAVMITAGNEGFILLAVNLGIALVWLVVFECRRVGHPLTPAGVVALGGLLIFALRPLTIASSGTTTPGAYLDTRLFVGATVTAGDVSIWQVTLFFAVFGAVIFFLLGRRVSAPRPQHALSPVVVSRSRGLLILVTLFALTCTGVLIRSSGGMGAYFSGISLRSSFLAGHYFLTLSYIPLAVALALYVLARRFSGLNDWDGWALSSTFALLAVGFTTGGRGPLLLGVILPLLMLKQTGTRRFSTRALVIIGLGLLVGGMLMSIFLRDDAYTGGAATMALKQDPIRVLLDRITSGTETRPFDSLVLLNELDRSGSVPLLLGATYAAVPGWFLPGSIAAWKDAGANTWFTRTYVPRFYYPDHIETSISAIGEAYANFRYIGIVIVAGLLAVAAVKVSVRRAGDGLMKTLVAVVLTPLFFSFIRGDAYQNVSVAILTLIMVGLFAAVTGVWRKDPPASKGRPLPRALRES